MAALRLALVVLLLTLEPAAAGEPAPAFAAANLRYQAGDFVAAERLYRQLVDEGFASGELFYNLGNACYKQRKLGEAIYFWEKARRRLPRDRELRDNLDLANLRVVDRVEVPPDPLPVRILDAAVHLFDVETEVRIGVALWVLLNVAFGLARLTRSTRARRSALAGAIVAAGLLAATAVSLGWKLYEQEYRKQGVVVSPRVDVRSGPGRDNVTVFTVHEGMRVQVRGEAAGWYQVSLPNGWTGWTEKQAVRVL